MGLFSTFLFYKFNDMSALFVQAFAYYTGKNYLNLVNTGFLDTRIDILNNILNSVLFRLFNPVLSANILAIIYILLSIVFSFILFRSLFRSAGMSILFSLLYSTSIYFVYRVISFTPNLYQIFLFPLTIYLLHTKKIKPYILGILVAFFFTLSSYYAYFALILVVLWYFSNLFLSTDSVKIRFKQFFTNLVWLFIPICLFLGVFYFSLLVKNFPVFNRFNEVKVEQVVESTNIRYRPIEDYYNFSFRPWYFFIPPKNSLFFGTMSRNIYKAFENTNYYLATNYTEEESAGSFIGWHFALGLFASLFFLFNRTKYNANKFLRFFYENVDLVRRSFLVILFILLLSHPPSITIGSLTIYTPSYLLYYIAPVFRTLVRFSVIIYLFVLIINGVLIYSLYSAITRNIFKYLLILTVLIVSFVMFAIKLPLVTVSKPPQEIAFLSTLGSDGDNYLVYPKGNYYSIFWVIYHHKNLVNPQGYILLDSNDPSELVNISQSKDNFLQKLQQYDIKYLVFYPGELDTDEKRNEAFDYFGPAFGNYIFKNSKAVIYKVNAGSEE